MAVLSAPFFEELIFRGVLYNVLRRYLGGLAGAIVAAFIFSISHGIGSQILGLWVLGLMMTWLYERTGRLVASMTFHCINNAMAMGSLFSMMQS
jgi:membrane protease YdiL (CAAX protease family)